MSYIYWQSLEQRGCLLSTPSQISPCALCHTPPRCKSSSSTFLQCPTCHTLSPLVPRTPAARPSGHVCFLQRPNRLSQQTPHTPASLFSSRESASNSPGTDLTPPGQMRHLTLYIHCLRHWRSPTVTLQADTRASFISGQCHWVGEICWESVGTWLHCACALSWSGRRLPVRRRLRRASTTRVYTSDRRRTARSCSELLGAAQKDSESL